MKKLSLLIIVLLTAFSCNNQKKEKTDLTKENLKGKVKSYTEISYKAIERFGTIEKGERLKSIQIKYNNKGNKIETSYYSLDGSLSSKHIYKYDNKGNKIEMSSSNSFGKKSKYIYKYDNFDKKGNWTKKITFKNGIPDKILERNFG
ncbi:hypothetical protein [Tenacibaculum finnmarkense]|uniref:hypothetical protein n=1 Tax=Tenacibaculum finnmarkense TaxID=2781243 RepID=UPI001E64B9FD|nr:hypothetical protein [Tenacibaculum finnmarkense]MCD8408896.1 hypothetical protein [Tenacibaculum finnmarkense genomovar ulcerans]